MTKDSLKEMEQVYSGRILGFPEILDFAPKNKESQNITIFKMDGYDDGDIVLEPEIEKKLIQKGLKFVDPFSLAAWIERNPQEDRCIATVWKDAEGAWNRAGFTILNNQKTLILHIPYIWNSFDRSTRPLGFWWFAGCS